MTDLYRSPGVRLVNCSRLRWDMYIRVARMKEAKECKQNFGGKMS
jgi:hypothetical protein